MANDQVWPIMAIFASVLAAVIKFVKICQKYDKDYQGMTKYGTLNQGYTITAWYGI